MKHPTIQKLHCWIETLNKQVNNTGVYVQQGLMRGNNQDWSSYFPTQPQEIERIIPVPDETILIVYFIDVAIFPDYPQFDRLKFPMLNIPEEALADSMIGFKSLSAIEEFLAEPDLAKYKISSCSCNCGCK